MLSKDCMLYIIKFLPYADRIKFRYLSKKYAETINLVRIYLKNKSHADERVLEKLFTEHVHTIYSPHSLFDKSLLYKYKANTRIKKIKIYFDKQYNSRIFGFKCSLPNLETLIAKDIDININDLYSCCKNLKKLKYLYSDFSASNCYHLNKFKKLEQLELRSLPGDINKLQNLKILKLDGGFKFEYFNKLPLVYLKLIRLENFNFKINIPTLEKLTIAKCPVLESATIFSDLNIKIFKTSAEIKCTMPDYITVIYYNPREIRNRHYQGHMEYVY